MKKFNKIFLSLALVLVLALPMLAGCSRKNELDILDGFDFDKFEAHITDNTNNNLYVDCSFQFDAKNNTNEYFTFYKTNIKVYINGSSADNFDFYYGAWNVLGNVSEIKVGQKNSQILCIRIWECFRKGYVTGSQRLKIEYAGIEIVNEYFNVE